MFSIHFKNIKFTKSPLHYIQTIQQIIDRKCSYVERGRLRRNLRESPSHPQIPNGNFTLFQALSLHVYRHYGALYKGHLF